MFNLKRAGGLTAVAGAALLAGCSTLASDPSTQVSNNPATAGTGNKLHGSLACREANIRVVRSNSLGMVFGSTVINGYTYPSYQVRPSVEYAGYGPLFSFYRSNPSYLSQTTLTSTSTQEVFTLLPGKPPEEVGKGFGALAGGVLGNMVGGGSVRVAATVLGTIGGFAGGQKLDNAEQTQWLTKAERCARDVEDGAYNRNGGPLPQDKAYVHPLSTWGPAIHKHLPVAPGYVR